MIDFGDTLLEKAENTKHYHFPFNKFHMLSKTHVAVNNSEYGITRAGLDSLLEVLEIPKPYAAKCPEDFLVQTVNYWLDTRGDSYWSLLVEKDNVRSFMRPEYPYIPAHDIWSEVVTALGDDFTVQNNVVRDDRVEVVALSDRYDATVVDSIVQGGMRFEYSDSWSIFPKFDSYLLRLVCLNGMTSQVGGQKMRVSNKSREEIMNTAREFISKSVLQIPAMIHGMQELSEEPVDNAALVLRRICLENKLPNKLYVMMIEWSAKPDFLATLPHGEIRSMHDIINLITYVASHNHDITEDHREHLFNIGGTAALNHTDRCGSCGGTV